MNDLLSEQTSDTSTALRLISACYAEIFDGRVLEPSTDTWANNTGNQSPDFVLTSLGPDSHSVCQNNVDTTSLRSLPPPDQSTVKNHKSNASVVSTKTQSFVK